MRVKYHLELRGQNVRRTEGRDVLVDVGRGKVLDDDFDLVEWARAEGVLKAWETVA